MLINKTHIQEKWKACTALFSMKYLKNCEFQLKTGPKNGACKSANAPTLVNILVITQVSAPFTFDVEKQNVLTKTIFKLEHT